ncbi:MAG: hypothetical protein HRU11_09655 [Parvularculaceae bacterium]|nr:hypothetical protein [Parvularculaceae bacterium]
MFVVFDLDGTLADVEHRRHYVADGRRDWLAFFDACDVDPPMVPVVETFKALKAAGHRIEIWSGRSDRVRSKTEVWLASHGLEPERLRMRAHDDFQPDDDLKESWLDAGDMPDLIFDDRQKVVDMWRRRGIPCAQVAPGDF